MTREDAIKFGKRVLSLSLFDETHEFCEIAVKALEQEPCDDVVSRQAIMKLKRHNLVEGQFVSLYDIERLPSVRPQEPRENDEISERNLKMWQDIFEEEKRRTK